MGQSASRFRRLFRIAILLLASLLTFHSTTLRATTLLQQQEEDEDEDEDEDGKEESRGTLSHRHGRRASLLSRPLAISSWQRLDRPRHIAPLPPARPPARPAHLNLLI